MAVAHYNKVSFYLDKPFTAEQIKAFEQAQRTAGKKKPAATPTDDLPVVKHLLLDFFAAMTEWAATAARRASISAAFSVRKGSPDSFHWYSARMPLPCRVSSVSAVACACRLAWLCSVL